MKPLKNWHDWEVQRMYDQEVELYLDVDEVECEEIHGMYVVNPPDGGTGR